MIFYISGYLFRRKKILRQYSINKAVKFHSSIKMYRADHIYFSEQFFPFFKHSIAQVCTQLFGDKKITCAIYLDMIEK